MRFADGLLPYGFAGEASKFFFEEKNGSDFLPLHRLSIQVSFHKATVIESGSIREDLKIVQHCLTSQEI